MIEDFTSFQKYFLQHNQGMYKELLAVTLVHTLPKLPGKLGLLATNTVAGNPLQKKASDARIACFRGQRLSQGLAVRRARHISPSGGNNP